MPNLSVIIPTYNRAEILKDCLIALAVQRLDKSSFEVIVGDDGSSDNTRKVLERAETSMPYRLRWFTQDNAGPNRVRNRAIEMAEAPVVVFFNDDTIATPHLLEMHDLFHREHPEDYLAFLGKVTIDPELPYSPFAELHLDSSFSQWEDNIGEFAILDWRAFYTCNLSIKKTFLLEHGLFDEDIRYSDDVELGSRLDRFGLKIFYFPQALGFHRHFLTEKDYLNIARREGKGLATWYLKRPQDCNYLKALKFPPCMPQSDRLRYLVGDMVFNSRIRSLWLTLGGYMLKINNRWMGFLIYKKLYQAIKREAIYEGIRRNKLGNR